ncbi:ribosomal protein S18 acetylase RimI-like enzyme [Rhizobium sp. BK176]|nr:GNAT family N-acetyltransferase [Rhizobium sp. BK399]MBB3544363.1 ribosomal protein S18 acetylase RimI-like enzyme [Rhizobium sp. BK399]MCS3742668.1 ribosomal protein S18 acetylase RimI-like enzyme [Rhizobium sp. BK661]MCS4094634.1 ribosomal protein S18 acetylase RimI-like enzyme [Rhizobium sp. BK176]
MLRAASLDDLQAVEALTAEAYAPYTRLLGRPPIPVTEDYAPRIERGEVWLREVLGGLAGLAVIERHPDHVMLFSVAVSPKFQGGGHGLAILRWVEATAREWQLPEVRLYTNARMERNIALYRAFGFQETGRRENPHRPGWVIVDMAKHVDAQI